MMKHIVLFKFRQEASEEQKQELVRALRRLKNISTVRGQYIVGVSIGSVGNYCGTHDCGLISEFENTNSFGNYLAHPLHIEFVDWMKKQDSVANVVSCDFEA